MASTTKRDAAGRVTLTDQELAFELQQLGALATELTNRIGEFMDRVNVRATVLSSVTSSHRSAKAGANHLRAAQLLAESDV